MLRSYLLVAGVATIAIGASAACGGTSGSGTSAGTGGGGGTTNSNAKGAQPPDPGPMKAPDGMGATTFAVSKLYLGESDRDGTPDKVNGWKKYGYNLDGKIGTATSTDLCKPRNNTAPKAVHANGPDGIDNAFGKSILPIVLGIASDAPTKVNDSIAKGAFTIMISISQLGSGNEYNPLIAKLYAGAALAAPPKWDGSDAWPVVPELLTNPTDISTAKVQFPMSYLVANTWVSGSKGTVDLSLSISGFTLDLPIASALISFQMNDGHTGATLGTIAGVLETAVLTTELKKVAGAFDVSLCSGPTIDSIVSQIESASDIMKDGTQDATKSCDGISIGLGFDAKVVKLGAIGPKATPKPDKCAMTGGAGGGSTSTSSASTGTTGG